LSASEDNQPFIAVGKAIRTRLLDELGPVIADVDPDTTLFHPGGAALMRNLATARSALGPTLALSSRILAAHGNIGSASVLWVLDQAWQEARVHGPELRLVALGPGIVSTDLLLTGVEVDDGAR
jgi:predicted naringenin-chalcone synthase